MRTACFFLLYLHPNTCLPLLYRHNAYKKNSHNIKITSSHGELKYTIKDGERYTTKTKWPAIFYNLGLQNHIIS